MSDHSSTVSSNSAATRMIPRQSSSRSLATGPPGLAIAFAELMEKALEDGFPIVVPVRLDATAEQISRLFEDVRTLIEKAGLAPAQTVEP